MRAITRWKRHEAAKALRQARSVLKHSLFDVRIAPKISTFARVLIVTPRKSGNAVERNLFRRRVRTFFYENKLHEGDYDWLIFAKPDVSGLPYAQLRDLLLSVVHSLSIPPSGV